MNILEQNTIKNNNKEVKKNYSYKGKKWCNTQVGCILYK